MSENQIKESYEQYDDIMKHAKKIRSGIEFVLPGGLYILRMHDKYN